MAAHLPTAVGRELFDGQGTLSPSLMSTAQPLVDGNGDPRVLSATGGMVQLARNASQSDVPGNKLYSLSDYVISMPSFAADAVSGLRFDADRGEYVNKAGLAVWFPEGHPNMSPYADPNDFTSATPAGDGQAWAFIHPRPFAAVGPVETITADELLGNVRAARAVQRYIVVFKPCRIYAALIDINKSC